MSTKATKKLTTSLKRVKKPKQRIVGLKELRGNIDEYLEALDRGEKVTVVRRSKPIFIMQHPDDDEDQWETIIDFTEGGTRPGIEAGELLEAMKKFDGQK